MSLKDGFAGDDPPSRRVSLKDDFPGQTGGGGEQEHDTSSPQSAATDVPVGGGYSYTEQEEGEHDAGGGSPEEDSSCGLRSSWVAVVQPAVGALAAEVGGAGGGGRTPSWSGGADVHLPAGGVEDYFIGTPVERGDGGQGSYGGREVVCGLTRGAGAGNKFRTHNSTKTLEFWGLEFWGLGFRGWVGGIGKRNSWGRC